MLLRNGRVVVAILQCLDEVCELVQQAVAIWDFLAFIHAVWLVCDEERGFVAAAVWDAELGHAVGKEHIPAVLGCTVGPCDPGHGCHNARLPTDEVHACVVAVNLGMVFARVRELPLLR